MLDDLKALTCKLPKKKNFQWEYSMADTEAEKVFKHCHKSVIWKTSLVECGSMANEKRVRPIFYAHDYKTSTILNQI